MTKEQIISVQVCYYDMDDIPEDNRYVASISEGEYKHTVVSAGSIADCFKEIATSMYVLDEYRTANPPKQ